MITKIHFKLLLIGLYLKKNFLFLLIGLALGSALFVYRDRTIALFNSPQFTTHYIGIEGHYTTSNLPEEILNHISYGLTVNTDNDKQLSSPLVASIDRQNDNKEYIIKLNKDFVWHNGKKFTSADINYEASGITVTPVSPYELRVTTETPFAPIYTLLSKQLLKRGLVGLGKYQVKNIGYQEGHIKTISLQSVDKSQPNIIYRFYQNEKDLINAFKLGEIDQMDISSLPSDLTNWPKVEISQKVHTDKEYLAIFLNTAKLSAKQLRQALAYATPKAKEKNERCLGPISPSSWAYNPLVKEYSYNPTRAKELYEKFALDSITLHVMDRRLLPVADTIKESWQQNLKLKTTVSTSNQIDMENYDAILAYGGIPHDPDQYTFWHSTQTKTNLTKINNSRIDKLLEEGRQTFDPIERKKIYFDFQKYLLEESPAIYLSYPNIYTVNRIK